MLGQPYFVVFSAEWCDAPCHSTMHAIWGQTPNATVLSLSTDRFQPAGHPRFLDWHLKADQFDDERDGAVITDHKVNSDHTYAFMKGPDAAAAPASPALVASPW